MSILNGLGTCSWGWFNRVRFGKRASAKGVFLLYWSTKVTGAGTYAGTGGGWIGAGVAAGCGLALAMRGAGGSMDADGGLTSGAALCKRALEMEGDGTADFSALMTAVAATGGVAACPLCVRFMGVTAGTCDADRDGGRLGLFGTGV